MNKRQKKKTLMRSISNLYSEVFERGVYNKDVAIVAGVGPRGKRMLTTVMIKGYQYEFVHYEGIVGVTLEGYIADRKVIEGRGS